jgi:serine-type D-Ala-D-Ala carboxypeptidase (penicillin-binding protein 5/6)
MRLLNIATLTTCLSLFIFVPITFKNILAPQVKSASISTQALPTLNAPLLQTTAQSVTIFDTDTKTFLKEENSNSLRYPASLTKIATALVAYQVYDLNQILEVKSAPFTIGNSVDLNTEDQLSVESLLFALLVSSGNDAALTLAENYPGGYSSFIDLVNQYILELGLTNTHFTNVSGLDDPNHQTTAHDLTILANELIQNPVLAEIVSTTNKTIFATNNNHTYNLHTTNQLLGKNGVSGIKTGWTDLAGENLITLTKRDGHSLIIVVMGSKQRFADSEKLIDWTFENISWN